MEDDDSNDDDERAAASGPAGNDTSKRALADDDKPHSYSLLLVGNLLDFGQDADASHIREIPIQLDSQITQASCGLDWILLLTASGRAYSCGLNAYGQLGQGGQAQTQPQRLTRTNSVSLVPKPLLFPIDRKIVRISCGACHGGFVVENGTLFMFGCSSYGRLGIGETSCNALQHSPTQVRMTWSMLQAKVAASKASVSCGIPVIYQNLKLSVEPSSAVSATSSTTIAPQVPETEENQEDSNNDDSDGDEVVFADISCGDRHTLVLGARASSTSPASSNMNLTKNSIITFGDGMNGRLGIGSESDQLTGALITVFVGAPQYSKGGGGGGSGLQPKITSISAGVSHNAALSSSGELFTWGNGADGQLGHSSCESEWVPRQVDFFKSISLASVKCGARHTIVVTRTGAVYTWGRGAEGQLGTGNAGLRGHQGENLLELQGEPVIGWKPEKVHLMIDSLAIQQMHIDAQVQAAFAAPSGGGSGSGDGGAAGGSLAPLQQQGFRVAVRSIVAKANVCMALDEHARLFMWGSNHDSQLGFPASNGAEKQLQSRPEPNCPPEEDICPLDVDTLHTTAKASSYGIVPKPKQLMYMDLHEPARKQLANDGTFSSSSSRVTTIRDQVHAMSVTAATGFSRQSLAHIDASERFSLLVFKTEPKLTGGLRGATSRNNSILIDNDGVNGSITEEDGSSLTLAANSEYESGNPVVALSFPNKSQMRLLVHQQQQRQQSKSKSFEPLAREGVITTSDGLDSKKSTKWHFSLLQGLRSEDMPSREREYYTLMASYKVHIRPQCAPGRASGDTTITTIASASTECSSTRHLLGFDECDYDIGGLSSIASNNNSSGRDHSYNTKNASGGRRNSSQRVMISRRAMSANNNTRTPRVQHSVDDSPSTTMTANGPSLKHVRGFEDWFRIRSPQASPKKQYAFGNAPRFQEHSISSSSAKEAEGRSPVPVSAAKANRIASPTLQAKLQSGYNPAGPEPPSEPPSRPKSAFGRTSHTTFSSRKMTFMSGSNVPATSKNTSNSPALQPQCSSTTSRVNPSRIVPIPATPVKASATAAAAPPQRPKTARAASANARSRNRASLKLQLHQQERALHSIRKQQHKELFAPFGSSSKSRFGLESPCNSSFSAAFGSASTPLRPETSTPFVYPTSPRFSMGSGEDYSLVVARRLALAKGGTPGPGTYDRHGG